MNNIHKLKAAPISQTAKDAFYYERALDILHRMATEQTGWRRLFKRWFYSAEPLRNDAANLVREVGYQRPMPEATKLVGD
jgi:hypothetical protein